MGKFFTKDKPEKAKLLQDWLTFARENLLYARDGMGAEYSPYHTICFLCQGRAEKYLKAYLISKGWDLKKIHDIGDLVKYAIQCNKEFTELLPLAKILNAYITEGRYPGDLPFESIGEKDAKEAIDAAEKIEVFVMKKMESFITPEEENGGNKSSSDF